jgi:hypothetical protein
MSRTKKSELFYREAKILANENRKSVVLQLPNAHPKQHELITALDTNPNLRFVVGACGTKFGKTYGTTIAMVKYAWTSRNSLNWWVAPTYAQSKMAFAMIKRLLPEGTFDPYQADMKIVIKTPAGEEYSTIEFKSGDNPDSLRGFGVHFFVMDEAARCPYESFVSLLTTTTQTRGKGFVISTPKGRGWFYDVYQKGEKFYDDGTAKFSESDPDPHPEWFSIRMPSWLNPRVDRKTIEEMRRNLPEDVFQQEVGAQFLTDSAGVFRGIKGCIRGELQPPVAGQSYVMGVDLARLKDYSVITVMNREQKHVVHFDRFNQISWQVQYQRIIETAKRYRATVVMDSTGIGDPIVEAIQSAGIRVVPYKITGTTAKQQLIEKLRVNIEKGKISFPLIPVMRRELESYEYEISDAGRISYSAPSGQHDDTVISLALANLGADVAPFVYHYSSVRGI